MASLSGGGFVVTWESEGQDGSGYGVYAQRYDVAGAPVDDEFQVNSSTSGWQFASSVTGLPHGGFVIAWSSADQDGSGYGIYAQRYDAAGAAVGNEFQVNSYTSGEQLSPSVTTLSDGGFVVTWISEGNDGSIFGISGQRYDAAGARVGGEFQVNTYTSGLQVSPSVAALPDGGFVVTWTSYDQDGSGGGVYGQRYDRLGGAVGNEFLLNQITPGDQSSVGTGAVATLDDGRLVQAFAGSDNAYFRILGVPVDRTPLPASGDIQVNTTTTNNQDRAAVTALSGGGFVVTWQSEDQDGSGYGIYAQRYDESGAPVGGEFQVNTATANDQDTAAVSATADGGYIVVWASTLQDGSSWGVFGQRYDASGAAVGSEFSINTYKTGEQYSPALSALSDGGFVVTWQSNGQDGSNYGIYGQRYNAAGEPVGGEFQVNSYTNSFQGLPSATGLLAGGFVVTWESVGQDGSGSGVFGQRYDARGAPVGGEFRVNTSTFNRQGDPDVTALADGGFVVTWESLGQDGSQYGVFGQRYDASGTPVGGEFRANTYTSLTQWTSGVAGLPDGGFVVTWESALQDGSGYGLYGQRFDRFGNAVGNEFRLNAVIEGNQNTSEGQGAGARTLTTLSDGRLVQIFFGPSNGSLETYVRVFDVPLSVTLSAIAEDSGARTITQSELLANVFDVDTPLSNLTATGLAITSGSGKLIANGDNSWTYTPGANEDGSVTFSYTINDGAGGRTGGSASLDITPVNDPPYIDFTPVPVTGDIPVNANRGGMASLSGGDFVIAWSAINQEGNFDVLGQRYATAEFRIALTGVTSLNGSADFAL